MENKTNDTSVMHKLSLGNPSMMKLVGLLIIIALLGVGSGYVLAQSGKKSNSQASVSNSPVSKSDVAAGKIYGSDDLKTYNDNAEGILKKGGIEGEGQYHLERPGGPSQYVYLTSSHVDLSLFIDRKIKVWGQTQTAEKAGWLMDAGRVEVVK